MNHVLEEAIHKSNNGHFKEKKMAKKEMVKKAVKKAPVKKAPAKKAAK